jgi:hypothetical protein
MLPGLPGQRRIIAGNGPTEGNEEGISVNIPLSKFRETGHVRFRAETDLGADSTVDVYTGFIRVDQAGPTGTGGVSTLSVKAFLPMGGGKVWSYGNAQSVPPPQPKIDTAVSASPSGWACLSDDEDEPATTSVDWARVDIEPQTIDGVLGKPLLLVLTLRLAVQRCTLFTVTYHVTVAGQPIGADPITIGIDVAPD